MSAQMERMMRQMGGGAMPPSPRILELNPGHAAVKTMLALYDADKTDSRVDDLAHIFYDQARLAEGSKLEDPAAFARRVNELIPLLGVSA
jgi:molecular chaperone HtpG